MHQRQQHLPCQQTAGMLRWLQQYTLMPASAHPLLTQQKQRQQHLQILLL
jgi:hypothetical protein